MNRAFYFMSNPNNGASIALKVISFLFPFIGWIIYFACKNDNPKKASDCATSAWIGFAVAFVLGLIGVI